MIETRLLRYFLAAAEEQSITKAAEQLHVTQPTLSKQLMELEQLLGKQLLVRGKKSLTLTEDGFFLRNRAKEILTLLEQTETSIRAGQELNGGTLHVGIGDISIPDVTLQGLQRMHQRYPSVQQHIYNESTNTILDYLNKGLVDLAILLTPTINPDYHHYALPYHPRWGLILPTNHPLAQNASITLDDLPSVPLIYPHKVFHTQFHPSYFPVDNKKLNIAAVYNHFPEAAILTEAGLGYAYTLEGTYAAAYHPDLTFRPVEPEIVARLYLLAKKGRKLSHAASVFLQLMQQEFAENE